MSLNIIDSINFGYGHLEPMIVGLMAMNKNFLLIGRHGAGKSRLAKVLSQGYGKQGYVFYDATKDDLISIAGIPNSQAIKEGHLTFTPHQRSIWDKSTVVVDEITRASKENQNLWLEILEDRTCFGMPLSYRTLIATANPESYAAAFKMDDALLDRFYAVLTIPDLQENMGPADIKQLLHLSFTHKKELEAESIARIFSEIQKAHSSLIEEGVHDKIINYCSNLVSDLLQSQIKQDEEQRKYISPRTYARILPESIMAVTAYHKVAGTTEPLQSAAADCIKYCLGTKHNLNDGYIIQLHNASKKLLKDGPVPESDQIRFSISSLRNFEDRLAYLQDNRDKIKQYIKADELEKFLGVLLQGASKEGEKEKLVHLKKEIEIMGYTGDILRQIDGNLILTLNSAISTFIPILNKLPIKSGGKTSDIWNQVEKFKALIEQGEFINLQTDDAVKLKAFLIDVYEEDVEAEKENIYKIFREIDLG